MWGWQSGRSNDVAARDRAGDTRAAQILRWRHPDLSANTGAGGEVGTPRSPSPALQQESRTCAHACAPPRCGACLRRPRALPARVPTSLSQAPFALCFCQSQSPGLATGPVDTADLKLTGFLAELARLRQLGTEDALTHALEQGQLSYSRKRQLRGKEAGLDTLGPALGVCA